MIGVKNNRQQTKKSVCTVMAGGREVFVEIFTLRKCLRSFSIAIHPFIINL